jgi:DNA-binding NtrC family response regulator
MEYSTILYISGLSDGSDSVLDALKQTSCQVVTASSPTEGIALLYIMHSVAAVVIDNRAKEQASFDLSESLKHVRPNVPVVLPCGDQAESSSARTDGCVSTDKLASALQHLLSAEPVA